MLQIFHRLLLLSMIGCLDCSLVSGLRMFKTYDKESLSAHNLVRKFLVQVQLDSRERPYCKDIGYGDHQLDAITPNFVQISPDDNAKVQRLDWLWHQSFIPHLNSNTLNKLAKDGLA
ncbi:hypothetical protein Tco_0650005 [Tanacetum coccineum]